MNVRILSMVIFIASAERLALAETAFVSLEKDHAVAMVQLPEGKLEGTFKVGQRL